MLEIGVDSYISLEDAEQYIADYAAEPVTVTERDLKRATLALDRLYYGRFKGVPTSLLQSLAFPRNGATTIPTAVAHATVELAALFSAGADPFKAPAPAVVETTVDVDGISRRIKYATSDSVNALHAIDLILAPYLLQVESTGGITWIPVVTY